MPCLMGSAVHQRGDEQYERTEWRRFIAFSPDGRRIFSGSSDYAISQWDAATGRAIGAPFSIPAFAGPGSIAFSPDGSRVVIGAALDYTVVLWDAVTGREIGPPLTGAKTMGPFAFSQDGRHIVSGSEDDNTIRLWDAATGQQIGSPLTGHTGVVNSVAFSPDGRRVVSGSDDKTIRLWEVDRAANLRGAALIRFACDETVRGNASKFTADELKAYPALDAHLDTDAFRPAPWWAVVFRRLGLTWSA